MKISAIILATFSVALAEPPVPSNEYLPSNQYLPPQNKYLPPQNNYLPPSTAVTSKYLPPSTSYGTPVQSQAVLKSQYRPPTKSYVPPRTSYEEPPSSIYTPPSNAYGAPSTSYGTPSSSYGTPKLTYSAPAAPSSSYGVPYGKEGYGDESEPANYEFEYHVQDSQSGNDFGHKEQRVGDVAQGKYFVLLPDGRLQTVEYTADEEGYKPRISYQQVGGGFSGGSYASGSGGYQY